MCKLTTRFAARAVAVLDLVIHSIYTMSMLCGSIRALIAGRSTVSLHGMISVPTWVGFSLYPVLKCAQILAAVALIRATEKGKDGKQALKMVGIWGVVNFIYFLSSIIECFFGQNIWQELADVLLQAIFIAIVCLFVKHVHSNITIGDESGSEVYCDNQPNSV